MNSYGIKLSTEKMTESRTLFNKQFNKLTVKVLAPTLRTILELSSI